MVVNTSQKQSHIDSKEIQIMRDLRLLVKEQLDDLTLLCTIVEYLNGFQDGGIDQKEEKTYREKLQQLEHSQNERFMKIDVAINNNIYAIKKGRTKNQLILLQGKEIRKLEAGLRTLRIFATDMVDMLSPNSKMINRVKERLYYFNHRAAVHEVEIQQLIMKLPNHS